MSINNPFVEKEERHENRGASFLHLNDVPNLGILLCDPKGYIVDANRNFCDLLALSIDDIRGEHISADTCLKMGLQQVSTCFEDFLTVGVDTYICEHILKNGTKIFLEINVGVLSSKHIGFFVKNSTEERKLRAELQEALQEMKVLNDDKNRFISVLAHDLKNPFNTIIGFIGLLKEKFKICDKEEVERYISYVEIASNNAFHLLEDTLEWISSESGKLILTKDQCALNEFLAEVVAELNITAQLKNISIHFSPKPQISVFCDARIVKTVLRNLLSNAIKFTNKGGKIIVDFEQNDLEVIVSVSDSGIGMAPDLVSNLFKIGSLNSHEGTGREKGTGLGLLICKELVEKHHGKIWVTSELGIGSNFKFTIPKQAAVKE